MKVKVNATLLICCAMLGAITVETAATIIENDQVKVLRALEKPHVKANYHQHKLNRVMVYLQPGRQRFEYQDGGNREYSIGKRAKCSGASQTGCIRRKRISAISHSRWSLSSSRAEKYRLAWTANGQHRKVSV
ncbi:MAG: hypothetical protein M3Y72_09130 [Acidobacteriota bacterium]|nr:hypothetical protein [Acidobacteriota bacterium]